MKSFKHYLNESYTVLGRPVKFVRYGGLSPVKQKGYNPAVDDFHAPPARHGVYAFVWPYVEYFLVGSSGDKFEFIKDASGNKITEKHPEYQKYLDKGYSSIRAPKSIYDLRTLRDEEVDKPDTEKGTYAIAQLRKPKIFEYYGPLWHHLSVKGPVLAKKGSWVKTDFDTFVEALKMELHRVLKTDEYIEYRKGKQGVPFWQDHSKKPSKNFSRDHLEVFIDQKI